MLPQNVGSFGVGSGVNSGLGSGSGNGSGVACGELVESADGNGVGDSDGLGSSVGSGVGVTSGNNSSGVGEGIGVGLGDSLGLGSGIGVGMKSIFCSLVISCWSLVVGLGLNTVLASLIAKALQLNCMSNGAGLLSLMENPFVFFSVTMNLMSFSKISFSISSVVSCKSLVVSSKLSEALSSDKVTLTTG